MQRPIYNILKKINNSNIYPFHMPGHKRNKEFLKDFYEFIDLDFTEIDETDNMHNPQGVIKNSQENLANIFNSDSSYFLVNGSSGGIIASLISILKPNQNVLVARNCHISVYNGIILSGANPIYIYPDFKYNLACGINPAFIEKAINMYNISACIITSPTYEGITSDIYKIANILHNKNIPLIVDEAHGAHFNLSSSFPKSALAQGADIVIQSFHKTLPAFTQCAVLHLKSNIIDKHNLEKCISIIQTTSPSYMFMLSLEYCCNFVKNNKKLFNNYIEKLIALRAELINLKNFKLIHNDIIGSASVENFDISRLTFLINKNVSGSFINNLFIKNGIQLEMYSENHIIAISTICDTEFALNLFLNCIKKIDYILDKYENKVYIDFSINEFISKPNISPKDIFYKEKKLINLYNSENKICADFIVPYPPGVPIILPGELITKQKINEINSLIKNSIKILGLNDNKIFIV